MKKIQAFTLVEILMASFIFMIIVTVGVSALSMMRKTSESSSDLSAAAGCARELEGFIRPKIQQAQFGDKFYGIVLGSPYTVEEIPANKTSQYSGIVILNSKNKATLIFKSTLGVYWFAEVDSTDLSKIQDKLDDNIELNGGARIQSDSCLAFTPSGSQEGSLLAFGLDFTKPFKITKTPISDSFYYRATMTDYDFSRDLTQTQAIERQSYARIYIDDVVAKGGV